MAPYRSAVNDHQNEESAFLQDKTGNFQLPVCFFQSPVSMVVSQ